MTPTRTHTHTQDLTQRLLDHRDRLDQQARASHQRHITAVAAGIPGTEDAITHGLSTLTTMGMLDVVETALSLSRQRWPGAVIHNHLKRAYGPGPAPSSADPASAARRAGWAAEIRHLRAVLTDD